MSDAEVLAYLAGFIDGEGSIGVYRHRSTTGTQMTVVGTDRRPLDMLIDRFGGGALMHGVHGLGYRPQWTWQVYNGRAQSCLSALLPYLVVKREQAEQAMRFPFHQSSRNYSQEEKQLREELGRWFANLGRIRRRTAA